MLRLRLFTSSLLLIAAAATTMACGPSQHSIDNPLKFHFYQGEDGKTIFDLQREENIRLWGELTSRDIPADSIARGVYGSTLAELRQAFSDGTTRNDLLQWINSHNASDLRDFMLLAKELEELRARRASAWYYPSDKSGFDVSGNEHARFDSIISLAVSRSQSGRLADRYAVQAIRALMSTRQYQKCVDLYGKTLRKLPDRNIFKQMGAGYVGGCYRRLGETAKSDRMFIMAGDYNSLSSPDELAAFARQNPESPVLKTSLNNHIGYGDDADNRTYAKVADEVLKSPYVLNRGDWIFLKAYVDAVYNMDYLNALKLVRKARAASFSDRRMAEDARYFELCMRYKTGDVSNFDDDTEWMLSSYDNPAAIWLYLIPALIHKKQITDAMLVANYAASRLSKPGEFGRDELKNSNLGFQMIQSYTAADAETYLRRISNPGTPFERKVAAATASGRDCLNELIGTLHLREGNYADAAEWFALVPDSYVRSQRIYPYLNCAPWYYNYAGKDKWHYPYYRPEEEPRGAVFSESSDNPDDFCYRFAPKSERSRTVSKREFAFEMVKTDSVRKHGATRDERALASLRYAIGRYNSFVSCWALTRYWRGYTAHRDYQLGHWLWNNEYETTDYLRDTPVEMKGLSQWFEREVTDALIRIESREALAEVYMTLRNYRTVARELPDTKAAVFLKTHCDNWTDWL